MVKPNWKVETYTTADGRNPTQEFVASLPPKHQVKCVWYLDLLEQEGFDLTTDYSHHVVGPIRELIADCGRIHYRFLYFFFRDARIIITHGFDKRTQKVEQKHINFALQCLADYENRYPKG